MKVWDAKTGRLLHTYLGHTNRTTGLSFAPDSRRLASASVDGTVKIWDLADLREPAVQAARTLPRHPGSALSVTHRPSGRFFATAHGFDINHTATVGRRQEPPRIESVTIWDAKSNNEVHTLTVPDPAAGACHDVAFDKDFGRIAWARGNGTIEIRDAATGRLIHVLTGHNECAWRVAFSPDGRLLASAGRDATVRVWDTATGRPLYTLPGVSDLIVGLGFSPDGRRLALAGADFDLLKPSQLRVWDVATGRPLGVLGESFDYATMAFHSGEPRLARSVGAEIFVLDVMTGGELLRLRGHTEAITSMAYSPDGRRLASVAHDGTVKLWDSATGREILTLLHGRSELMTGVSFSPDGRQIVTTSESGTIKVWDATPLP